MTNLSFHAGLFLFWLVVAVFAWALMVRPWDGVPGWIKTVSAVLFPAFVGTEVLFLAFWLMFGWTV